MTHDPTHSVITGRRPGTERCNDCSWTFPCREETCGHSDCIEFREELPKCHFCEKRVQGYRGGACSPNSSFEPLRQLGGENASWTAWNVRGHTRAVHYECLYKNSSPNDLARWGALENSTRNQK